MSQQINDNFRVLASIPIDSRFAKQTINDRDLIPVTERYEGLICYVVQTQVIYILVGGTDNTNWQPLNGAAGVSGVATYTVEGYPFIWQKGRSNTGVLNEQNVMEQYDIIMFGFCDYDDGAGSANRLIKLAQYNTGDPTFISSYNVIEYI